MLRSQGSDTRQSIKPGRSTLLGLQGANLSFLKIHFFNAHMCVCVNLCAPHACRCPGRPEGVGFPGTRITGLCERLGTKPGFSARAVSVLTHWVISSVPIWFLLMYCPDPGDRCAHILALEKEFNSSASFKGGLQWRTHRWFIKYPENQTGSHFFLW